MPAAKVDACREAAQVDDAAAAPLAVAMTVKAPNALAPTTCPASLMPVASLDVLPGRPRRLMMLPPLHSVATLTRCACLGRRASARRRHDGSHPRQGPDDDRPDLDLRPRRPAVRRPGSSGGAVLRLARPDARTSRTPSGELDRRPASRRRSAVTTAFIFRIAGRARSSRRYVGAMRGANSSNWPTSRPTCDAAKRRRRARRSLSRRSNAWTRSST
jgi:hypothetical protein